MEWRRGFPACWRAACVGGPTMSAKSGVRLRAVTFGLFLAAVLSPAAAHPAPPVAAQPVAPAIDLPTEDGRIKPADLAGKLVYVDFFASWCGPCKVSFPWLKAMHGQYAAEGLVIVAVNVDKNRGDAAQFIAHYSPPFLIGYDPAGRTAAAFHVEGMPSSFLISPTGTILYSHVGFDSKDAAKIEAQIKKALIQ
jgi:cytochrome c biogenesis protein CcmG/thiol:disulfide interchange protein DsbE